jgi:hypothetical protein
MGLTSLGEHLLDWFHVTMRLTVMSRLAKGVRADDQQELSADLQEMLEHLKWNLWHGKVPRALEIWTNWRMPWISKAAALSTASC